MSFERKPLFPDTPPVRSDLRTPYLNSYGPKNQALKAPAIDPVKAQADARRVALYLWYWHALTPEERYEWDCEFAEARGLPVPKRKGKAYEPD